MIIALLFPFCLYGQQSIEKKPNNGKYTIVLDKNEYIIQKDTSETGIVTVIFIPTAFLQKELESELGSIDGELEKFQEQVVLLQKDIRDRQARKKQIEKLILSIKE
jgi:hypothetical protein